MVIMNPKTILGSTHIAEQFFFYDSFNFDFQLLQPNLNLTFNPTIFIEVCVQIKNIIAHMPRGGGSKVGHWPTLG